MGTALADRGHDRLQGPGGAGDGWSRWKGGRIGRQGELAGQRPPDPDRHHRQSPDGRPAAGGRGQHDPQAKAELGNQGQHEAEVLGAHQGGQQQGTERKAQPPGEPPPGQGAGRDAAVSPPMQRCPRHHHRHQGGPGHGGQQAGVEQPARQGVRLQSVLIQDAPLAGLVDRGKDRQPVLAPPGPGHGRRRRRRQQRLGQPAEAGPGARPAPPGQGRKGPPGQGQQGQPEHHQAGGACQKHGPEPQAAGQAPEPGAPGPVQHPHRQQPPGGREHGRQAEIDQVVAALVQQGRRDGAEKGGPEAGRPPAGQASQAVEAAQKQGLEEAVGQDRAAIARSQQAEHRCRHQVGEGSPVGGRLGPEPLPPEWIEGRRLPEHLPDPQGPAQVFPLVPGRWLGVALQPEHIQEHPGQP